MYLYVIFVMVMILQWNAQALTAHVNEFKNAINNWGKNRRLYVSKKPS